MDFSRLCHVNLNWLRKLARPSSSSCGRRSSPRPESDFSEDAKRATGGEMTLDVEVFWTAAGKDKKRWADPGDLKLCILRSRRRTGGCEFSARLFLRKPCLWRADNSILDFFAP